PLQVVEQHLQDRMRPLDRLMNPPRIMHREGRILSEPPAILANTSSESIRKSPLIPAVVNSRFSTGPSTSIPRLTEHSTTSTWESWLPLVRLLSKTHSSHRS